MQLNEDTVDFGFAMQIQVRFSRKIPDAAVRQVFDKIRRMTHVAIENLVPVFEPLAVQPPDGSYFVGVTFEDPTKLERRPVIVPPTAPNLAVVPPAPSEGDPRP